VATRYARECGLSFDTRIVLQAVAFHVGGEALVRLMGLHVSVFTPMRDGGFSTRRRVALPRAGRGVVRCHRRGQRGRGHVMPWENGVVYDPLDPKPMTLSEWRAVNPGWITTYITQEEN